MKSKTVWSFWILSPRMMNNGALVSGRTARVIFRRRAREDEDDEDEEEDEDLDDSPSFFENLLPCVSASLILAANLWMFWYVNYAGTDTAAVERLVLLPDQLFRGEWLAVLTTGFVHFEWIHLLINMLGVYIFARVVEDRIGCVKTLFVYLGSMAISMSVSCLIYSFVLDKDVAVLGASGAVMGLLGAAVLLDPFRITWEMILPIPVMFKGWMFLYADVQGLAGGEMDGVSHLAHLIGFLSVGILVYFLSNEDRRRMRNGLWINILSFALFVFAGGVWIW